MKGQEMEYLEDDGTLEIRGEEEDPARVLAPSRSEPDQTNELRGPVIRFMRGGGEEPDRLLVPEQGLVRIYTGPGESFYATDRMEPRSEEQLEEGEAPDPDPRPDAKKAAPSETEDEPSLTEVRCTGPMTLVRGEYIRFEKEVLVERYQPPGVLQATTRCALLTLYLEPPSAQGESAGSQGAPLLEKVSRVVALGDVTFSGNDREGSGSRLMWIPGENSIELKGDDSPAQLRIRFEDGRVMTRRAQKIQYNFKTDHMRSFRVATKIRGGEKK